MGVVRGGTPASRSSDCVQANKPTATQKLVETDAKARHENAELHRGIEAGRADINKQRDLLERERREIANQRHRDPIVAESIKAAVALLVAALPLVVCLFILRGLFQKFEDEAMVDLLVEELISQQPLLGNLLSRETAAQPGSLPVGQRIALPHSDRHSGNG